LLTITVRDENDEVIRKEFPHQDAAEDWLLRNADKTDWTNQGTNFWEWD
jgi:hypothetical protein